MLRLRVIKVEATHVERSQLVGLLHVKQYLSNARFNLTGIAFFLGGSIFEECMLLSHGSFWLLTSVA
jgi:hypothetical protein